jgi:branched-chain amino acid transport system ATP-binding protein
VSLLEVDGLTVGYGSLPVLRGVSFSVEEGSTAVLLGLNGAGKTTTVNTVAGLLRPWSGEVRFDGRVISRLAPEQVVAQGVALSLEGRHVFPGLTVRVNLELGAWTRRRETRTTMEQVFSYFPRLEERADQLAGTLSGGEQQMLAIGRALMARPRLLLVDEASLGLSPKLAETVFAIVDRINEDGTTVVLVEQNVGALAYADQALVMEKGTITFDGPPGVLAEGEDLRRTYLGDDEPVPGQAPADPVPGGQAPADPVPGGQAPADPVPGGQAPAAEQPQAAPKAPALRRGGRPGPQGGPTTTKRGARR